MPLVTGERCECLCGATIAHQGVDGGFWLKCRRCRRVIPLGRRLPSFRAHKVKPLEEAIRLCAEARSYGLRVVMTCGCFDLLHGGHVHYLEQARHLGELLVVALNSDESMRRIKTRREPVHGQAARASLLAALEAVDMVVVFDADAPIETIRAIRPHVWVKGGDYTIDSINQEERRACEEGGGVAHVIPTAEGTSTTQIIERIQAGRAENSATAC